MLYTVLSSIVGWDGLLWLVGLFALSVLLVRMGYFRLNLVFLVLLTAYTVASLFFSVLEPIMGANSLLTIVLVCADNHYRAKWKLGEVRLSPKTYQGMHVVLAAAMTILTFLVWQEVSVFASLQKETCLLAAVYFWAGVFDNRPATFR
jgi:hypothetical protein